MYFLNQLEPNGSIDTGIQTIKKLQVMLYCTYMASRRDPEIDKKLEELGNNLRKVREDSRRTQDEVAKVAGLSSNYYAKIERGGINTTFEKLYKIIKALKTKASEIFPS